MVTDQQKSECVEPERAGAARRPSAGGAPLEPLTPEPLDLAVLRSSSTVSPNGVICALCLPVCRGDPRVCRPATDPRVSPSAVIPNSEEADFIGIASMLSMLVD